MERTPTGIHSTRTGRILEEINETDKATNDTASTHESPNQMTKTEAAIRTTNPDPCHVMETQDKDKLEPHFPGSLEQGLGRIADEINEPGRATENNAPTKRRSAYHRKQAAPTTSRRGGNAENHAIPIHRGDMARLKQESRSSIPRKGYAPNESCETGKRTRSMAENRASGI